MLIVTSVDGGLQTEPVREIMFEKFIDIFILLNPITRRFD